MSVAETVMPNCPIPTIDYIDIRKIGKTVTKLCKIWQFETEYFAPGLNYRPARILRDWDEIWNFLDWDLQK